LPEPLAETMTDSIQAISAAPAPSAAQSIGRNSSQSNYKARTASESAYDQSLPSKSQTYINDPFITQQKNTENYQEITTNSVIQVADQSTSTFSIDVDTGAYSNVRRMLPNISKHSILYSHRTWQQSVERQYAIVAYRPKGLSGRRQRSSVGKSGVFN